MCTGATEPVITPALYHKLLAAESGTKVVVDLAVPNNVDTRIPRTFPVKYVEIEGLRELASENLAFREQERRKAETLITEKVRAYRELWHQRQVERALLPVVDDVRDAKERAVSEVFAKELAQLDPTARQLAQRMLEYMEKKSVAAVMRTMKEIAAGAGRHFAGAEKSA